MKQNLLVILFAILLGNIANAQNVGVGTANPKARLEIKGLSTSDTLFQVKDDGDANRITLLKNGSFGIGTSAPKTRLHVAGGASNISWTTAPADVAIFEHGSDNLGVFLSSPNDKSSFLIFSTLADRVKGFIQYINQDNEMLFVTGGTEKMRILNNGNVGIGDANPVNKLQVNGNGRFGTSANNYVYLGSGATVGNGGLEIFTTGNVGYIRYHDPGVAWRNLALADAGGNVGIGTITPNHLLDVQGNIEFGTNNLAYPTLNPPNSTLAGAIIGKGATADYRIQIQDGTGRVNHYWNAYTDALNIHRYQVSSIGASRLLISDAALDFFVAPTGTAGNAITWTNAMNINSSAQVTLSNLAGSGNRNVYANASGTLVAGTGGQGFEQYQWSDSGSTGNVTETTLLRSFPEWFCTLGGHWELGGAGESCRVYNDGANWYVQYKSNRSQFACHAHCIR